MSILSHKPTAFPSLICVEKSQYGIASVDGKEETTFIDVFNVVTKLSAFASPFADVKIVLVEGVESEQQAEQIASEIRSAITQHGKFIEHDFRPLTPSTY